MKHRMIVKDLEERLYEAGYESVSKLGECDPAKCHLYAVSGTDLFLFYISKRNNAFEYMDAIEAIAHDKEIYLAHDLEKCYGFWVHSEPKNPLGYCCEVVKL